MAQDLTPEAEALRATAAVILRKMQEDGDEGDPTKVPEYVDSLLASANARFPGLMDDDEKLAAMRQDLVDVVSGAMVYRDNRQN